MSRAFVPLIVLALTAGQNVALLCDVWCPAPDDAVSCQHHITLGPAVTTEHCNAVATSIVAVGRDDLRRGASARDTHAVAVPEFLEGALFIEASVNHGGERLKLPPTEPRLIALRI